MIQRIFIAAVSLFFISMVVFAGTKHAADALVQSMLPALSEINDRVVEVPILMYHKVNPDPRTGGLGLRVPPDKFDRQMAYLARNGFHTVSLTDVVAHFQEGKPLPPRPVVITFDDGYLDNYTYAFPILKKYNFTATIFVVAGTVGGINSFDVKSKLQPVNQMAGWRELKEMAGYGITIGSHTLDHPHLARVSPAEARRQIKESKQLLEARLGRPVQVFCYPYGSYNQEVARLVKESGYLAAVTTVQGIAGPGCDPFTLKRVRIMGNYDMQEFIMELLRYYHRDFHQEPARPAGEMPQKSSSGGLKLRSVV